MIQYFVDIFVESLLKSRRSELEKIISVLLKGESLAVTSLSGSGKSVLLTQALPLYLSRYYSDRLVASVFSGHDANLHDHLLDLNFSSDILHLVVLDDLSPALLQPSLYPLWDQLSTRRNHLSHRLVFIFISEKPLDPASLSRLGFSYLENPYSIAPFTPAEITAFLSSLTSSPLFTPTLVKKLILLSAGNLRLIKNLAKELESGKKLDKLLASPVASARLLYFFSHLQHTSALTPAQLQKIFPEFTPYFRPAAPPLSYTDSLTGSEKKLLDILLQNRGTVVGRDAIVKAVWSSDRYLELYDHSLDQLIYRLKQKLKDIPYTITARKGRGFVLN